MTYSICQVDKLYKYYRHKLETAWVDYIRDGRFAKLAVTESHKEEMMAHVKNRLLEFDRQKKMDDDYKNRFRTL